MSVRRVSDLPYLYTIYPDAELSDCLMEVSYSPKNGMYQSFCEKVPAVLSNMFKIPVATKKSLGTVQIGEHINVDENGVISVAEATSTTIGLTYAPPKNCKSGLGTDANGHFISAEISVATYNVTAGTYEILDVSYPKGSIYIRSAYRGNTNVEPPGCNPFAINDNLTVDMIVSGAIGILCSNGAETSVQMQWKLLPSDFCPWSTHNANEYGQQLSASMPIINMSGNLSGNTELSGQHLHSISYQNRAASGIGAANLMQIAIPGSSNTTQAGQHAHKINVNVSLSSSPTSIYNSAKPSYARPNAFGVVMWQRIDDAPITSNENDD